jgi:hypothetical protein
LENIVHLSHIKSFTVFGKWKSFLISKKVRLLQVLDLENIYGLKILLLEHIMV